MMWQIRMLLEGIGLWLQMMAAFLAMAFGLLLAGYLMIAAIQYFWLVIRYFWLVIVGYFVAGWLGAFIGLCVVLIVWAINDASRTALYTSRR